MSPAKSILFILAAGIVKALKPLVTIRFGSLFVSRLGHLAGNTECYLCEKKSGINRPKRVFDIWCPMGKPANEQLFKMYKRVMPMSELATQFLLALQRFDWFREHIFSDANWGRDIHNVMEKYPPFLKFIKAEEKRGQQALRLLGIPEGEKWVCIIARDSMYLRATEPAADYSYHSFRDSDIQNYREAAVALMDRGYYVIRMGRFVEGPMKLQAPKFIDYACSPLRSDFLDVYLGAKCAFTISNGTGFDGIPMIFRRPICFVNEAPYGYLSTWMKNSLAIWKHHVKDGRKMSPEEIVSSGAYLFDRTQQYADAGITLVENSSAEIIDAALEMDAWLKNEEKYNGEEHKRQLDFWRNYPLSKSPHTGQPLHGEIRLRIGSKFLASYAH